MFGGTLAVLPFSMVYISTLIYAADACQCFSNRVYFVLGVARAVFALQNRHMITWGTLQERTLGNLLRIRALVTSTVAKQDEKRTEEVHPCKWSFLLQSLFVM